MRKVEGYVWKLRREGGEEESWWTAGLSCYVYGGGVG